MAEKVHEHVSSDEKSDDETPLGEVEKIVAPPTIVAPPRGSWKNSGPGATIVENTVIAVTQSK